MTRKLYQHLASTITARQNCLASSDNTEWATRHEDAIHYMARECLPSGSGIDNGIHVDLHKSTNDKIVLTFAYHHLNDGGYYDGWTDHTCIVRPDLQSDIRLRITGRNRNGIKDYLYDTLQQALTMVYTHTFDQTTNQASYARAL